MQCILEPQLLVCTLTMLSNFIWDVGVDTGDGYDGVDVFLLCGEMEFDGGSRDEMTLAMVKGPAHLWTSFFMGWLEE